MRNSAGIVAQWFQVSPSGLVEWSTRSGWSVTLEGGELEHPRRLWANSGAASAALGVPSHPEPPGVS